MTRRGAGGRAQLRSVQARDELGFDAQLAVDGLLLRRLGPGDPRFEPDAVVDLLQERRIAALAFDLVRFNGPGRRAARPTRRLCGRLAGFVPRPPRLARRISPICRARRLAALPSVSAVIRCSTRVLMREMTDGFTPSRRAISVPSSPFSNRSHTRSSRSRI